MNATTIAQDDHALQLLTSYREGNDHAFTELYGMFAQMMLNYGSYLTSDKELVKDCIQDVFCKVLDRTHPPRISKMTSYLIIALRNRLVDEFRKRAFTTDSAIEEVCCGLSEESEESLYMAREQEHCREQYLGHLMHHLTPRQHEAFRLYYIEERKYDEICTIMHMDYHSVRNLVYRGMLRLRAAAV